MISCLMHEDYQHCYNLGFKSVSILAGLKWQCFKFSCTYSMHVDQLIRKCSPMNMKKRWCAGHISFLTRNNKMSYHWIIFPNQTSWFLSELWTIQLSVSMHLTYKKILPKVKNLCIQWWLNGQLNDAKQTPMVMSPWLSPIALGESHCKTKIIGAEF